MNGQGADEVNRANLHYMEWKDWVGKFGLPDPVEQRYFQREFKGVWPENIDASVLEVGFGSGQFLYYAKNRGAEVTGVELNKHLVSYAIEAGYNAIDSDSISNLPASSFDLIVAFDVIEHIASEDIPQFLISLKRVLKPKGKIFLRYPNGDSWLGRINQNGDPTHLTEIGCQMMKYFCTECSLKITTYRAERNKNFSQTGLKKVHAILATPLAKLIAGISHIIYFPGTIVVLSATEVVCILEKDE